MDSKLDRALDELTGKMHQAKVSMLNTSQFMPDVTDDWRALKVMVWSDAFNMWADFDDRRTVRPGESVKALAQSIAGETDEYVRLHDPLDPNAGVCYGGEHRRAN